jgi:Holliday junction resolvase RusA-like endonuclease
MRDGELLRLFVPGRARTKGSLKPIHIPGGRGRKCRISLTEDHALSTPWKRTMIVAIQQERRNWPAGETATYAGAVEVHSFFRFSPRESVNGGLVPSQAGAWPVANEIGDEDKLRRNVLDALTQSALLADDALVVGGYNLKRWTEPGEVAGVQILVREARPAMTLVERLVLG